MMSIELDPPFEARDRLRSDTRDRASPPGLAEPRRPRPAPAAGARAPDEEAVLDLALCLILAATIVGLLMLHL